MHYNKNIYEAIFIDRPNRFNGKVKYNNEEIVVHVPNTGRCKEILKPGCKVFLREENNPNRKTKFDLIAAYDNILSEKTFGKSRFDFKLSNDTGEEYYLEVKGVTLEENKKCSFPDAPTERGRKHLLELIDVKKSGLGAGILFLIQIEGITEFSPNDENDPKFGEALRSAKKAGVDIFAYSCIVKEKEIVLDKSVDIVL